MRKNKVFVIALDGAPPDMIGLWARQGKLPLFKRLMAEGCTSELSSAVPWHTPTAWCSFMTGKNPGKHGVYNFVSRDPDHLSEMAFLSGASCKAKTLWRYLSERGRSVGVVNVPMTYPAEEVQGFLIAGFPALPDDTYFSYPKTLIGDLKTRGWDLTQGAATEVLGSLERRFEESWEQVQSRVEASLCLMREYPWDFFMVHFLETDRVGHIFWRFMEDGEQAGSQYSNYILQFYQWMESAMLRLMKELDDNTTLIIMSDHGMGPRHYVVSFNRWLLDKGYLVLKNDLFTRLKHVLSSPRLPRLNPLRLVPDRVLSLLVYTLLHLGLKVMKAEAVRQGTIRQQSWKTPKGVLSLLQAPMLNFRNVDWTKTAAYSFGCSYVGAIYLNVVGRRPEGIIKPGIEYDRIRAGISTELQQLANPTSGERLVRRVAKAEDLYAGPYLPDAPDLIVFFANPEYEAYPASTALRCEKLVTATPNAIAGHRQNGLFMIKGTGIEAGTTLTGASITDVAPTVLHILGEPIPSDMDGSVLRGCFGKGREFSSEVKYVDANGEERKEAIVYSGEEEEIVFNRLRELGYLD